MDEAISRQAVIEMLDETKRIARQNIGGAVLMTFERVFDSLVNITNALPTIQPAEPKTGKWILDRSGAYCCSKCMEPCAGYVMMKPRDKFCKMCGSRNEVTE